MKNLLYIGNKLSSHGFSVSTIETLGPLLEKEGHTVFYASSKKNKVARIFDMAWQTFAIRKKVDYLLIDTYSTFNFWYAFLISQIARLLNIRYVPILHGGNLPARLLKNPVICKMIFNNSFANVSPSKYLFAYFQDKFQPRTIYIPNVVELKNYPFKHRENIAPKLLWVRAFSKIYNPEMALKVLEILRQKYPNASLCMVGPDKDGSLKKAKIIAEEKKLNVKFTGHLQKAAWIKLSTDYDIFINTTHFDNMPVSIIEAMALGLPVFSTNVGGLPLLIEDRISGILVNDDDAPKMAEEIDFIIQNSAESAKLSGAGRLKATTFDWNAVKTQWKEILI